MKNVTCVGVALSAVLMLSLVACNNDDDGLFGSKSALDCIETKDVSTGKDITNTCDRNIIVLTDGGERLVITPGDTHRLVRSTGFFRIAACFSPKEPEFDGSEFTCG